MKQMAVAFYEHLEMVSLKHDGTDRTMDRQYIPTCPVCLGIMDGWV